MDDFLIGELRFEFFIIGDTKASINDINLVNNLRVELYGAISVDIELLRAVLDHVERLLPHPCILLYCLLVLHAVVIDDGE